MNYPSHLLDALGRVHAEAALDRLIRDEMAIQPERQDDTKPADIPPPVATATDDSAEGLVSDKSSD